MPNIHQRDYEELIDAYTAHFLLDRLSARTTVVVASLTLDSLVAIDCIARRYSPKD